MLGVAAEMVSPHEAAIQSAIDALDFEAVAARFREDGEFIFGLDRILDGIDRALDQAVEFTDRHVLLVLPSYPANLGVFERFMTTTGSADYQIGAAFRAIDMSTLLQTRLYHHYLGTKDIDLEDLWLPGSAFKVLTTSMAG